MSLPDRSARTPVRVLRPAILLLVISLHAALLLLASHWQARLQWRNDDSLMMLQLPNRGPMAGTSAPEPALQEVAPTLDIQLIAVPVPPPLAAPEPEAPPAPIDWNAEVTRTAKQQAESAAAPAPRALDQRSGGMYIYGPGFEPLERPAFGWDHAHIRRVEGLEGGGSMLWLNDRCFIAVTALIPFSICGVGKTQVRGDLFDQLREPKGEPRSNTPP
jgi:hypothetical protein